jgi:hypothetical protein
LKTDISKSNKWKSVYYDGVVYISPQRTQRTQREMKKDPFTGKVIGCAIESPVVRLKEGIQRFKI